MHRSRCEHEQQLGNRRHRLLVRLEDQIADLFGQRGAAGLARHQVRNAAPGQGAGEPRHLSGLADALDSLDGQEPPRETRHRTAF